MSLEKDIEIAINRASAENESNTPDWILAQYIMGCLSVFNAAVQQRETYYGRDARPKYTMIKDVDDEAIAQQREERK